ncbi:unnamed protein product [Phytophthora fragariaefolia]|uniref:Unnamed protein product n=1 Tax=Phytophthora fragariaefolia TaxID=1490495 RepID=A0A9W6YG09_9STRA|nr:unnamed protein product [Phytophthora fragariaefolia]
MCVSSPSLGLSWQAADAVAAAARTALGVFGYNPGLIREMDFRTALEGDGGFHEVRGGSGRELNGRGSSGLRCASQVVPITDPSVVERVHMNFRIQVIKDNVLSRSLPDGCVLLLEHMANENNFHILSYISENEDFLKAIKELVSTKEKRMDGLGLLKAIINLVRVTKPVDRLPQRRDPFGAPPVFGSLIGNLFGDGELFAAFAPVLGSPDSKPEEVALAVDILNVLVFYQGPDKLRAYLASEGKCIPAPTSDKERIAWTEDSSLFTAMLIVFERDEPMQLYFEKETESAPELDKNSLSEVSVYACMLSMLSSTFSTWFLNLVQEEVSCQNRPRTIKLVDYDDDDDETAIKTPVREGNPADAELTTSPRGADIAEEERELKLPVRKKKEDDVDTKSFLGGSSLLAQKKANQKKARSPQFKNVFQKISWKLSTADGANGNGSSSAAPTKTNGGCDDASERGDSDSNSVDDDHKSSDDGANSESAALMVTKRKLALEESTNSDSLLKKTKTCTPISSS